MKEILKQISVANKALAEQFNLDSIWHNVIDKTDSLFTLDTCTDDLLELHTITDHIREIQYDFKSIDELLDGNCYSIDVYGTSVWISKDKQFMLVCGDDSCGNRDFYIFDIQNNRNQEEANTIELQWEEHHG